MTSLHTTAGELAVCVDFGTAFSKAVIARPCVEEEIDEHSVTPLAIGLVGGEPTPLLASCTVFVGDEAVSFGSGAMARAESSPDQTREPMTSFKSILSAADLESAMDLFPPLEIDPRGRFRRRDLIVLFLAWLLNLIDEAAAQSPGLPPARSIPLRYTRPAWANIQNSAADTLVARLLSEARHVADALGHTLRNPEGVNIEAALSVLGAARSDACHGGRIEGGVFEAIAAAACHALPRRTPHYFMVFDMGAGTTDIAALRSEWRNTSELVEARKTLQLGGDDIDRCMLNAFLGRAKRVKSVAAQGQLWRQAAFRVRASKQQLFAEKKAAIIYEGRAVVARLDDLQKDSDFRHVRETLAGAFLSSLEIVAAEAQRAGHSEMTVVLAGGGASLPFVQQFAASAKPRRSSISVRTAPQTPQWVHAKRFGGQLAPVFSQLCIAIGGAIYPTQALSHLKQDAPPNSVD